MVLFGIFFWGGVKTCKKNCEVVRLDKFVIISSIAWITSTNYTAFPLTAKSSKLYRITVDVFDVTYIYNVSHETFLSKASSVRHFSSDTQNL